MKKSWPVLWHAERGSCNWEQSSWAAVDLQQDPVTEASDCKRCLSSTAFHRHPTKLQVHPCWLERALHSSQMHLTAHVWVFQHLCKSRWKQMDRAEAEQSKTCPQWAISYSSVCMHRHFTGSSSLHPSLEETSKSQSHEPAQASLS